jgi:hypothetical protein
MESKECENKPHSLLEASRNAVLAAGSNTIGCQQNIVTTIAAVSHNIWPTQMLAVLEVSAVVEEGLLSVLFVCAVLSSCFPSLIAGFYISSFLSQSFFLFCLSVSCASPCTVYCVLALLFAVAYLKH